MLSACSVTPGPGRGEVDSPSVEVVRAYEPREVKARKPKKASLSTLDDSNLADVSLSAFNSFRLHEEEVNALAVTGNSKVTYTGADDGIVYRSLLQPKGVLLATRFIKADKPILALAVSPDDLKLAIAVHSEVLVYDLGRGEFVNRLTRVRGRFTKLAWDPRGELLAMGLTNGDVYVWNLVDGRDAGLDSERAVELYRSQPYPVVGLSFHPGGRLLVVAHKGAKVVLWRLIRTAFEMGLRDPNARIDDLLVSKKKQELEVPGGVEGIHLKSDGSQLFVACNDGKVRQYKMRGLVGVDELEAGKKRQSSLATVALDEQKLLVSASRDKQLRFWCLRERKTEGFAQSNIFEDAINIIDSRGLSSDLWAAQKSGNLLHFDAETFRKSKKMKKRLSQCFEATT